MKLFNGWDKKNINSQAVKDLNSRSKKRHKMTCRDTYRHLFKFTVVVFIINIIMIPLTVFADSGTNAMTFEKDLAGKVLMLSDYSAMLESGDAKQKEIAENFKSATEYTKWYKKAVKNIANTKSGAGVTFQAKPNYSKILDDASKSDESHISESESSQCWTAYTDSVTKLDRVLARGSVSNLVGDIFDTDDFDPTNALVIAFMQSFKNAMNTLFDSCAQILMFLFLGQTGADALYLVAPVTGFIFARANSGGKGAGSGSMGGGVGGSKLFQINIVSDECIEAANGATASVGHGSGGGGVGGFFASNKFVKYITLRLPLVLFVSTYIVLVVTGIWPRMTSWLSGIVAQGLYSIV